MNKHPDLRPGREHGKGSCNGAHNDTVICALVIIAIGLAYVLAMAWDDAANAEWRYEQAMLSKAEAMGESEREWTARVAAAYAQGQRDAMAALTDQQGLEFAKACRAFRMRDLTTMAQAHAPRCQEG